MPSSQRALNAIMLVALLPLIGACTEAAPSPSNLDRPVQVQRVAFQSGETSREFVGVVRARYETDLGPDRQCRRSSPRGRRDRAA